MVEHIMDKHTKSVTALIDCESLIMPRFENLKLSVKSNRIMFTSNNPLVLSYIKPADNIIYGDASL